MIIGHGDIANVLTDRDDLIFFAAGVSNSQEIRESEYIREFDLLLGQHWKRKHLVYFSSLCIFYSDSRYASHKRFMECKVREMFNPYTIIRVGNITWGNNPHTLINHIRNKIRNRESFETEDVYRYICEKDEFLHWMLMIPDWSCEINIPGRRMLIKDIVKEYCYPWRTIDGPFEHDHTKSELQVCG